jgi:hypothetical protein
VADGVPYTICPGDKVSCTGLPDGSHVLNINGVACLLPAPVSVVCKPNGIEINGSLCAIPVVSVKDNGDCTGTITVNGTSVDFIICEKDPDQHDPANVTSADGALVVTINGQVFDLALNEVNAANQLAANPASVAILCAALTPCVQALIPAPPAPFVHPTPLVHVTDICANAPAKAALVDCVLSNDAGNTSVVGTDGAIYTPLRSRFISKSAEVSAAIPAITPLPLALDGEFVIGNVSITITNPSALLPLNVSLGGVVKYTYDDLYVTDVFNSTPVLMLKTPGSLPPSGQIAGKELYVRKGAYTADTYGTGDSTTQLHAVQLVLAPGATATYTYQAVVHNYFAATTIAVGANLFTAAIIADCWN